MLLLQFFPPYLSCKIKSRKFKVTIKMEVAAIQKYILLMETYRLDEKVLCKIQQSNDASIPEELSTQAGRLPTIL